MIELSVPELRKPRPLAGAFRLEHTANAHDTKDCVMCLDAAGVRGVGVSDNHPPLISASGRGASRTGMP
jgi:hypothetical protein